MRTLMNLICEWGREPYQRTPYTSPRHRIYHGTSEAGWQAIEASNSLRAGRRRGISLTMSEAVARDFARLAAGRDSSEKGVVVELDLDRLSKDFRVVPYRDRHVTQHWHIRDEHEMKVMARSIPNIMAYVINHYEVDTDHFELE